MKKCYWLKANLHLNFSWILEQKNPQIPFPGQEYKEKKTSLDFFTPLKKSVP